MIDSKKLNNDKGVFLNSLEPQNDEKCTLLKKVIHICIICTVQLCLLYNDGSVKADDEQWIILEEGLSIGEFNSPVKSDTGDSKITVVKIDPKHFRFTLLRAAEHGGKSRKASEWSREFKLVAAVNAGMFKTDLTSHVGYMKHGNKDINSALTKNYNAVIAFDSNNSTVPEVGIIDLECQDFQSINTSYGTLIQNIRMISCKGENVWAKQEKKSSLVVFAMDKAGNVLFIFSRSPFSVHDFINILLDLNISINSAAYLEGGSRASLCVTSGDYILEKAGCFETGVEKLDDLEVQWPIPNVIGIVRVKSR